MVAWLTALICSNLLGSTKWSQSIYPKHPDQSRSTREILVSLRDSTLSHKIEASGQPVQDNAKTLKSPCNKKEAT